MKAYLWKTGKRVSPFQDPVGESQICNVSLRTHQERTLVAQGLSVGEIEDPSGIQDPEYLLIRDDLFFAPVALKRFLDRTRETGTPGACAMESGPFTEFTGFIQDLKTAPDPETGKPLTVYGLYYCQGPLEGAEALGSFPPVRIESRQKAFPINPGDFMPASVEVRFAPAFADAILFHVCHWVHIWLLNLIALGDELLRTFTGSKLTMILRALSAFSLNKHKIASRFVVKGKGCDIHPTATVQGCILGDKVSIGPYSLVQGCILGNNVKIIEHSVIIASVLGDDVSTCPRGHSKLCVVYPKTSLGRMHACLIGRNVFMASLAYFFDIKLKGTIKLRHGGRIVDTGMNFLGGCVGHDAVVGPDVWIASGREIPNGAMVVKNPREVIFTIPPDLPRMEPASVWNSELRPVTRIPAAAASREDVQEPPSLPPLPQDMK
jgi:carbonic anhydrase/acetyltransferase-like protein (isoleucine patch superfamily)